MKRTLDYPPVWLVGFMAVAWGLSHVEALLGRLFVLTGWMLVGGGVLLAVWAALAFWRAKTTIVPHETPKALITKGPFRLSRNPIYLADLMILGGWAITCGTLMGLFLLIPFPFILSWRFIKPEEARMTEHLGQPYLDYKASVRRWI